MTFEQQLIKDILSNKVAKNVYEYIEGNLENFQKDKDLYRQSFLNDSKMVYFYAFFVDECPRDDTRKAACGDPWWAYMYAKWVDEDQTMITFKAVKGSEHEDSYIKDLGKPE